MVTSFDDTLDLERAILKIVTGSSITASMFASQLKEEYFTSKERRFIRSCLIDTLQKSRSVLTSPVFEYEVGSRIPEKDATYYKVEWTLIRSLASVDSPKSILERLENALVGRKAFEVCQDVSELLEKGNIGEAVLLMKRRAMVIGTTSEDKPLSEITDIDRRLETIRKKQSNPDLYKGLQTGFNSYDRRTGGLFKGEVLLIAGITGLGKSTLCRAIARGISLNNEAKNVLYIANEEYLEQVEHKFDALLTEIPYHRFKFARVEDAEIEVWKKHMEDLKTPKNGHTPGRIFIKEVPAFTNTSEVERAYRELENKGVRIDCIIIDHLPHVVPIRQAYGENDERAKAAADCKELARWLQVPVVIPTQAATVVEAKQQKGKRAGKMDVYGSKGQVHIANVFLVITDKGKDDTDPTIPPEDRNVNWLIDIIKNRDGAPFTFLARHFVKSGRVEELESAESKAISGALGETDPRQEAMKTLAQIDGVVGEDEDEEETPVTPAPANAPSPDIKPELNRMITAEIQPVSPPEPKPNLPEQPKPLSRLERLRQRGWKTQGDGV